MGIFGRKGGKGSPPPSKPPKKPINTKPPKGGKGMSQTL
jgi:hypothetical protein